MTTLREIVSAVSEKLSVTVAGARGSSFERLAVEISRATGRRSVILCSDWKASRRIWMNLYHLDALHGGGQVREWEVERPETSSRVLLLQPPLHSPYQDAAGDFSATMARQAVIARISTSEDWRYLVLPVQSAIFRVAPPAATAGRILHLSREMEIEPFEVSQALARLGYNRCGLVESPGTFAARGGALDIFPPSSILPVRIQWYGPFIERMRLFDPDTQRTREDVEEVSVPPVSPAPCDDKTLQAALERIRMLCERQDVPAHKVRRILEEFERPRLLVWMGAARFLPAFYGSLPPLLGVLPPGCLVLLLGPDAVQESATRHWEAIVRDFEDLREMEEPAFEPHELFLPARDMIEGLARFQLVPVHSASVAVSTGGAGEGRVIDLGADDNQVLVRHIRGDLVERRGALSLRPLARQIREWTGGGVKVTLTALSGSGAERLKSLLIHHGIELDGGGGAGAALSIGPAEAGYFIEPDGEALVTEEEVFGSKVRGRRISPPSARRVEDLRSLRPSDHVVHKLHGVGRYEGQVVKTFDSCRVELLKIVYRDGDILYVPVYHLNQVQKYMGGKPPTLDRLGGETFLRTKKKSMKAALELADMLLHLYASRKAASRSPFEPLSDDYYEFESLFPYEETPDQKRALEDIMNDLDGSEPMDRLLCGDVGFGKTEVAVRAAWRVAMSGKQVAVLVPTTVLAQQHLDTFRRRFQDTPIRIEMLSRFQPPPRRKEIVKMLREGKVDVVVGTHRLLRGDVHFRDLGLLVIDEEHRFGVAQKERTKFLLPGVDVLTMTATPIPRTLQMSLGKLMGLSIISTPPAHRLPIRTHLVAWSDSVIRDATQREIERGGQVFFLHNRIETIGGVLERLRKIMPEVRFGVAHGKMEAGALERVMVEFVSGKLDVLLCTAIIESGLDIPSANTIFINDAHKFGLAQLYQIRGRIGRASEQAYAYLILPERVKLTREAVERIDALMRLTELGSGLGLATMDLEIRGAGEILGRKQSGHVRRVGFELFCEMLEEAAARLRGEDYFPEIEPEIRMPVSAYIPEEYLEEVGLRLSFYKRMAGARDEGEVWDAVEEMEDRFGEAPAEVKALRDLMVLKVMLRRLGACGIEAGTRSVRIHLSERTPIDPREMVRLVQGERKGGSLRVTPGMEVVLMADEKQDPLLLARALLMELVEMARL